MKKLFAILTLALGLSGAVAVSTAQPAQAVGNGRVTLVFGSYRCVGGGYISTITQMSITSRTRGATYSYNSATGTGSNRITVDVWLNTAHDAYGRGLCYRPWYRGGSYWINLIQGFWPSYNGQTFNV